MEKMDIKYQALLDEAQRRGLTGLNGLRTCMELLSTARAIDRDCAIRLGSHGLSEGRFVLLFLLCRPVSPRRFVLLALGHGI